MLSFKGELKDVVKTFAGGYILTISTGLKNISSEEINALVGAKNGVKCDISIWRNRRSLDANAYFHALVNQIAREMGIRDSECKVKMNLEYGTVATDKNGNRVVIKLPSDVDITQFYEYAKWIGEREEKGLKLSYYALYKQTHTLDSKEMSNLIDGVVQEAKNLGIQTLDELEVKSLVEEWEKHEGKKSSYFGGH